MTRHHALIPSALLVAALVLGGCSDDDDGDDASGSTTEPVTTVAEVETTDDPTEEAGHDGPVVTVGLVDYGFEDLPATVEAGTTLTLENHSDVEMHEMVVFPAPDDRTASELVALPPEELGALFVGEPTMVLVAPPGESSIVAVGDGTLAEPGRYIAFCAIPTGADPQEWLAAAEEADGPPEVDGGPPHFTSGMYADLVVE